MIRATILLDSVSVLGDRLTTFELTYPRFIHQEVLTHKCLSRNSGSSRARPLVKTIEDIEKDPAQVIYWGAAQAGMQARAEIGPDSKQTAISVWERAKRGAIVAAKDFNDLKVHKQIGNRVLEPFQNITIICSATRWANFFSLRCHEDVQPEMQRLAFTMLREYYNSIPKKMIYGEWHTPLIQEDEALDEETRKKVSVARVARVSYLNHNNINDIDKDIELYERLKSSRHFSPFEHIATPGNTGKINTNFDGWIQLRKLFKEEYTLKMPSRELMEKYFEEQS